MNNLFVYSINTVIRFLIFYEEHGIGLDHFLFYFFDLPLNI